MKTKKQISTNRLKVLVYVLGGAILMFFLVFSIWLRTLWNNQAKLYRQEMPAMIDSLNHTNGSIVLYKKSIDSLEIFLNEKQQIIILLEKQKGELQNEVYRLQSYEMQVYNLGVSLKSARDSISQLLLFKNHLDYGTRLDLFQENVSGKIKAYPNPFREWIAIQNGGVVISRIRVVNIASQLVKEVLNPHCDSIPMWELRSGTYYLSIFTIFEGKEVPIKTEIIKK
jgi:hypothetical protein